MENFITTIKMLGQINYMQFKVIPGSTFALEKLCSCALKAISVDSKCQTVMDSVPIKPTPYIKIRSLI